jgi:transcriptional regulator with XRE-family HTH domain
MKEGDVVIHNLGERISVLRKNMNLSQETLAERIGVSRQAISKWERGEATPDIYNLTTLSDIFGMSVDELIRGEEELSSNGKPKIIALELKKQAEKLMLIGISIIILSAFVFLILPFSTTVNLLIFGVLMTIGILVIIKSGFMFERFYMYNKSNDAIDESHSSSEKTRLTKRKDTIVTITALSCTIVYLFISFVYGLWHPGWIVFLLIPISFAIAELNETKKHI